MDLTNIKLKSTARMLVLCGMLVIQAKEQPSDLTESSFSQNAAASGTFPSCNLLWKQTLPTQLTCACLCSTYCECVSYIFDNLQKQCYGLSSRMHDEIKESEKVRIAGSNNYELKGKTKTWTLEVWTGNDPTDNPIHVIIYGIAGATNEVRIDNKERDDFEKNRKDTFVLQVMDVGTPIKLKFNQYERPVGKYDTWFLKKAFLHSDTNVKYVFTAEKRLDPKTSKSILVERDDIGGKSKCD